MRTIIGEGITFDDVLLVPGYSKVIPNQVNLETRLTKNVKLNIPMNLLKCREVKTSEELEAMATAEEIGSAAYEYIITVMKPGMTEKEVAAELEHFMRKSGADGTSFETIVGSGSRSAMPHECEFPNPPRQIEFAKLYLTNVVTGKRYIKKLVEDGVVDGWDDPRLVSIAALRRRGFTPESIRMFVELCGVSKSNSSVDYAMLEYCIREDLKLKKPRVMAVLDPIKLIIENYPEGQTEELEVDNNQENPELGVRTVPFGRELYIERDDFMGYPVSSNTDVRYLASGEENLAALLTELEKAEKFIFMEYFLIAEGVMWNKILDVLERKAKQGVDVRVMYDGICVISLLPYRYPDYLRSLGIQTRVFSPLKPVFETYQNYRDHRKICVIDGVTGFTGGINIGDEYINAKERFGHWKDTAIMRWI